MDPSFLLQDSPQLTILVLNVYVGNVHKRKSRPLHKIFVFCFHSSEPVLQMSKACVLRSMELEVLLPKANQTTKFDPTVHSYYFKAPFVTYYSMLGLRLILSLNINILIPKQLKNNWSSGFQKLSGIHCGNHSFPSWETSCK